MTARMAIKISQIIRMRCTGIKDTRIAELMNLSQSGLQRILRSPEYIEAQEAYLTGHLSNMDLKLSGRVAELQQGMRDMVPAAQRALADAVLQRRDLKTMLAAAKEIFEKDPDKTFASSRLEEEAPSIPGEVLVGVVREGDKVAETLRVKVPSTVN